MVRRSAASHWSPGARLLKVSQAFWSDTTVVSEWRCPESFSGNLVWYRRRTGMKCSHWLMTVRCSKSFPSTLVRCSCGVRYGALHWTLVVWYLKASQASWFDTVAVSEMTCYINDVLLAVGSVSSESFSGNWFSPATASDEQQALVRPITVMVTMSVLIYCDLFWLQDRLINLVKGYGRGTVIVSPHYLTQTSRG